MTQTGIVKRLLDKGMAEVSVERVTACAHCSGCGECIYGREILVQADNRIYAQPGERVVLESETKTILQVTLLIYMLPVAGLFLGYGVGALLGLDQAKCIISSAVGLGLCALLSTYLGRRFQKINYCITAYKR